ncbi:Uncharacterised protein (plasmid) [Tsukamurella tyrosinosolvens]|uniref:Uncharacterized protein n=1 Tax=Tsukamurella tyrosinosolvens TaxID=57704 RepID=A0A1H4UH21_TSUTY|nr:hypothetical protein [Tsukamurella tyrosinosolvens]KXO92919.1 hypothetical protein AXK58_13685 [Tsukamurella tyrosinosolvens]SEC68047.1 hypothetical protein SAMN04489793_2901 [Tsukamurella tyrosinosolvens]VEH94223.1 Uncharacterised protein [Tsukamurella tyrosinosolvens]
MTERFTFALDERDQTPQWMSDELLVQVTSDGTIVAFARPNEDFDDYAEIDTDLADPTLAAMVEAAAKYVGAGGQF